MNTENGTATTVANGATEKKKAARKAPAKKASAKKTIAKNGNGAKKKATGNAGKGRRAKFSDNAKIKLLVKENPRRKGTTAYDKFAKFKDGMTVGEFIKAGERHEDWNMRGILATALARGQISVTEKA